MGQGTKGPASQVNALVEGRLVIASIPRGPTWRRLQVLCLPELISEDEV